MGGMFALSLFNGDISAWNVSNVKYMRSMFHSSIFKGDISGWNVLNVKDMSRIFAYSNFNGDISTWKFDPQCDFTEFINESPLQGKFRFALTLIPQ